MIDDLIAYFKQQKIRLFHLYKQRKVGKVVKYKQTSSP